MAKVSENNLVEKSKSLVWAKFRDYTAGASIARGLFVKNKSKRPKQQPCGVHFGRIQGASWTEKP